jgi:hypothetical protein
MSRKIVILLVFMVLCLTVASVILAAPDSPTGGLTVPWWTVDGGGGTSTGGQFALSGTAGQPDAATMAGGSYTLNSGFWNGRINGISGSLGAHLYVPFIER